MAANHVGHALLFFFLGKANLLSPGCRIIFVTTAMIDPKAPGAPFAPVWLSPEEVASAMDDRLTNGGVRCYNPKLAVVFFARALQESAPTSRESNGQPSFSSLVSLRKPFFGNGKCLQYRQKLALNPQTTKNLHHSSRRGLCHASFESSKRWALSSPPHPSLVKLWHTGLWDKSIDPQRVSISFCMTRGRQDQLPPRRVIRRRSASGR